MKGMKYLREVKYGERVHVYFNLRSKVWSLRNSKGHVIAHKKTVTLKNVEWKVRPGGRAKVVETGDKNVHAFAIGEYHSPTLCANWSPVPVRYNPFKMASFHANEKPIKGSEIAFLAEGGKAYADGELTYA